MGEKEMEMAELIRDAVSVFPYIFSALSNVVRKELMISIKKKRIKTLNICPVSA